MGMEPGERLSVRLQNNCVITLKKTNNVVGETEDGITLVDGIHILTLDTGDGEQEVERRLTFEHIAPCFVEELLEHTTRTLMKGLT
jgi:hypothetical protein